VRDQDQQLAPLFVEFLEKAEYSNKHDLVAFHSVSKNNQMPSILKIIDHKKKVFSNSFKNDIEDSVMQFDNSGR